MAISKFQSRRFHDHVVYTCDSCGKRTRDTGEGEADCNLCKHCFQAASAANSHSDGGCKGRVVDCPQCSEWFDVKKEKALDCRNTDWADAD